MTDMPETNWSLIRAAQSNNLQRRIDALGGLVTQYQPVLLNHLIRRRSIDPHRAADLLQGYVTDKILERDLVRRADQRLGRFRSLLLRSLENYVCDIQRRERVRSSIDASEGHFRNSDESGSDWQHPAAADANPFDVDWARHVLRQSFDRMRAECCAQGEEARWRLLEIRLLGPILQGAPEPSYEELVKEFQFQSPKQASNALITAKRHFRRTIESVVSEYVGEERDIEEEIRDLFRVASQVNLQESTRSSPDRLLSSAHMSLNDTESQSLMITAPGWGELFKVEALSTTPWAVSELPRVWRGCIDLSLQAFSAAIEKEPAARPDAAWSRLKVHQAVQAPPSIDCLRQLKVIARIRDSGEELNLPTQMIWAVYFLSIAAALVHFETRISKLPDEALMSGFDTLRQLPWLDEESRALILRVILRVIHR